MSIWARTPGLAETVDVTPRAMRLHHGLAKRPLGGVHQSFLQLLYCRRHPLPSCAAVFSTSTAHIRRTKAALFPACHGSVPPVTDRTARWRGLVTLESVTVPRRRRSEAAHARVTAMPARHCSATQSDGLMWLQASTACFPAPVLPQWRVSMACTESCLACPARTQRAARTHHQPCARTRAHSIRPQRMVGRLVRGE